MGKRRKFLTGAQRVILAHSQRYRCVGSICRGKKLLPPTWEADHIQSLKSGGTNEFISKNGIVLRSNFQILCPNCHSLKTQTESVKDIEVSPYFNHKSSKFLKKIKAQKNVRRFLKKRASLRVQME